MIEADLDSAKNYGIKTAASITQPWRGGFRCFGSWSGEHSGVWALA